MDYKDTLNLPSTKFPMKANLPQKEPEILKFWDDIDLYQSIRTKMSGAELHCRIKKTTKIEMSVGKNF